MENLENRLGNDKGVQNEKSKLDDTKPTPSEKTIVDSEILETDELSELVINYTKRYYKTKEAAIKSIERERKRNARIYKKIGDSQDVYETLYLLYRVGGIPLSGELNSFAILSPRETRTKIDDALEEREEMISLIIDSINDLSGWKELPFTYEVHPYLNDAYAPILAFFKRIGLKIKGSKILEVGFGSKLNTPQELAEQGAESYAIDSNFYVPRGIQRSKLTREELSKFEYDHSKRPEDFYFESEDLTRDGIWKKLPKTKIGGQVSFAHTTLEKSNENPRLQDGSFDAIYANELYEYGALYFPSEQESWDKTSIINLSIIFKKLKEGGIFISRTMIGHEFKIEQLKQVGFEVICYELPLGTFEDRSSYDSKKPDRLRMDGSRIIVCRKPLIKDDDKLTKTNV